MQDGVYFLRVFLEQFDRLVCGKDAQLDLAAFSFEPDFLHQAFWHGLRSVSAEDRHAGWAVLNPKTGQTRFGERSFPRCSPAPK